MIDQMPLVTSDRIYRASDLNRRGREVLDTARTSGARIVDTDGTSMVMVPERVLDRAAGRLDVAVMLVAAMRAWRELEAGGDVTVDTLRWINRLDAEDRATLAREVVAAFDEAGRTANALPLGVLLDQWETTASLPYDQEYLARLDDGFDPASYVEAERPTDPNT